MGKFKIYEVFFIIASLCAIVAPHSHVRNCTEYSSILTQVNDLIESQNSTNLFLEEIGYVTPDNIFGAAPSYDECVNVNVNNANLHTLAAQTFQSKFNLSLDEFENLSLQCNNFESLESECKLNQTSNGNHPKYRSIDGRGNNLLHTEWGASNTPFLRFGSKNYEDGIYTIKKSVTGEDLPNARLIVQEIFMKAVRSEPPPLMYNVFASLAILFVTHDLHYQIPQQPQNVQDEISCCSEDGHNVLPNYLSNLACLPIEVSRNDSFYEHGEIGCLNMVRSQKVEYTGDVEFGEIMNSATSYIDLSLIYGNHESELEQIRLYTGGQFRMGKNNIVAVDKNGNYLPSMKRFAAIPLASLWPALFFRNHNNLAARLAKLNRHWNDETLFQEARRINIALVQYNFITSTLLEVALNGIPINETYSGANPGIFIEFAFTYRAMHYFLHSEMLFLSENNTETRYLQSDTIGRNDLLENYFDDAMRGGTFENANTGPYSDEIINRIGKNSRGYGVDVIATDIQRSRDNGVPSYLSLRRQCQLSPEINSFDDFNQIFNETNVELLKKIYKSPEDVDFYVGGVLEIFNKIGNPFVGPTFACVIAANYNNIAGGDIYYYLHPESPYPFTQAQINSISNYSLGNIICANSGLKVMNQIWGYGVNSLNPTVNCTNFPPIDLSAWKEA